MLAHTFCSGEALHRRPCTSAEAGEAVAALLSKVSRLDPDIKVNLEAIAESLQEFAGPKPAEAPADNGLQAPAGGSEAAPSHPELKEAVGEAADGDEPKKAKKKKKRKQKDEGAVGAEDGNGNEDGANKTKGGDGGGKKIKKKKKKSLNGDD